MKQLQKGKVILAGAGPGDPDLITYKTLKYLNSAEVILTDRLVSPILIETHANPNAEIIYVGKQCSKGIHTPQKHINQLMVDYASKGKLVLRLKGGDASVFSNILDELEVLKQASIDYEIVPGISAAFGAAAYAAIPLTAREHARGLRLLTLFDIKSVLLDQWKDWANTSDTLVFYMSGQKLQVLVDKLIFSGIDKDKGLAIIQQATTPEQKTIVFSFNDLEKSKLPDFEFVPTLIIVGKVVNLHNEYKWLNENQENYSYFDNHKNQFQNAV